MRAEGEESMEKNNKTIGKYIFYTFIGLLILATGAVLAKLMRDYTGVLQSIPYIFIGIGAGIFGQNTGTIGKILSVKNDPEFAKQIEIEENDERNVMLADKARAKAYQLMIFVYGALMLAFAIMKVDIVIIITMVVAYLFIVGSSVYFRSQIAKKM